MGTPFNGIQGLEGVQRPHGRYILSSAVLSSDGTYSFRRVGLSEAMQWLAKGPAESGIGYETTAAAFEMLFSFKPKVQRVQFWFQPGDEGLVFRLKFRATDPEFKKSFTPEFVKRNSEIAILKREV